MDASMFEPGPSRLAGVRKRRCSDSLEEEEQPAAKVLIEDVKSCMIQLCCDEILMEIFQHLDSNSLQAISRTCCRFNNLVSDRRLWQDIDLTSEGLPISEIDDRLENMNSLTKRISVRGLAETYPEDTWNSVTVSKELFERIAEICPSLETLEIHNGFMNFDDLSIRNFPETLKKLVFDDCLVQFPSKLGAISFFTGIDAHLLELEELTLANCNWFDTHDLVLFSKLKNLKKLSLRGCESLKDCVPYGSISTRFGFKKLEELDVRDTPISDSDIQCFNVTYTLQTLKLECPENLRDPSSSSSNKQRKRPSPYAPNSNGNDSQDDDDANLFHLVVNDYSAINVPRGNGNNRRQFVNPRREAQRQQQAAGAQNGAAAAQNGVAPAQPAQEDEQQVQPQHEEEQPQQPNGIQQRSPEQPQQNGEQPQQVEEQIPAAQHNGQPQAPEVNPEQPQPVEPMQVQPQQEEAQPQPAPAPDQAEQPPVPAADGPERLRARLNNGLNRILQNVMPPQLVQQVDLDPHQRRHISININLARPLVGLNQRLHFIPPQQPEAQQPAEAQPQQQQEQAEQPPQQPQQPPAQQPPQPRHNMDFVNPHRLFARALWFERRYPPPFSPPRIHPISDMAVCSFGSPRIPVHGIIRIQAEPRPPDTNLRVLIVRHYKHISDTSLNHLTICAPKLVYLDFTGTSVTEDGIRKFKERNPNCFIVSDHFTG